MRVTVSLTFLLSFAAMFSCQTVHASDSAAVDSLVALEQISAAIKANFERIRTWSGKYREESRALYAPADKVLLRKMNGSVAFSVDQSVESFYYKFDWKEVVYTDPETGKIVTDLKVEPFSLVGVVNPGEYLNFYPGSFVHPESAAVPQGVGQSLVRRAERSAAGNADDKRQLADVFNALDLFGEGKRRVWQELQSLLTMKDGTEEKRAKLRNNFKITVSGDTGNRLYKLEGKYVSSSPSSPALFVTTSFSEKHKYNPIRQEARIGATVESSYLQKLVEWDYTTSDDICYPSRMATTMYNREKQVSYQRTLTVESSVLNESISPDLFTYKALGLKDGDWMRDNIKGVDLVYLDGNFVEPTSYYNQVNSPEDRPETQQASKRWGLVGVNVLIVAALLGIWLYRRGRGRPVDQAPSAPSN